MLASTADDTDPSQYPQLFRQAQKDFQERKLTRRETKTVQRMIEGLQERDRKPSILDAIYYSFGIEHVLLYLLVFGFRRSIRQSKKTRTDILEELKQTNVCPEIREMAREMIPQNTEHQKLWKHPRIGGSLIGRTSGTLEPNRTDDPRSTPEVPLLNVLGNHAGSTELATKEQQSNLDLSERVFPPVADIVQSCHGSESAFMPVISAQNVPPENDHSTAPTSEDKEGATFVNMRLCDLPVLANRMNELPDFHGVQVVRPTGSRFLPFIAIPRELCDSIFANHKSFEHY